MSKSGLRWYVVLCTVIAMFIDNSKDKLMAASNELSLCTQTTKVDFNPFREFTEFSDLYYLILTTASYISTDPQEVGILSKWDFSPDGKKFYAVVNPEARWQDGTRVNAMDAAYGIAKGLTFREIGHKVRVEGTQSINQPGWKDRKYSGIKIKNDYEFELTFESEIKALAGTIRDALSTGARHNRIWPARLSKISGLSYENDFDVVSKFPIELRDGNYFMRVKNRAIRLVGLLNQQACDDADFMMLKLDGSKKAEFSIARSESAQGAYMHFNPKISDLKQRRFIASAIRNACKNLEDDEIEVADSHFKNGEIGWDGKIKWDYSKPSTNPGLKKITISTPFKSAGYRYKKAIEAQFASFGIQVEWKNPDYRKPHLDELREIDVFLFGGRIAFGRQIWIQDLSSSAVYTMLNNEYGKLYTITDTHKALVAIAEKSSSTVPVNHEDLRHFDEVAYRECEIVPMTRVRFRYFSRKGVGMKLIPTKSDELTFSGE